jgi:hypothetical protein
MVEEKADSKKFSPPDDRLILDGKSIDFQRSEENRNHEEQSTTLFSNRVSEKPFWIWNIEEHKAVDILTNGDSSSCF